MLIINTSGVRWPKPDLHSATVHRQGHHKDYGNIGYEHEEKVLLCDAPTAAEHDQNLKLVPPEADREQAFHSAADFLGEIAAWFAESGCVSSAGTKAWALALLLRPHCCPERNAFRLAVRLGITRQAISKYMSQIQRLAHGRMRSPALMNDAFRKQRRRIAVAAHRRKGHTLHAKK